MTTNQKTKPQHKATDTPEEPLTFHLYRHDAPDVTLCGERYTRNGKRPLSDRSTGIPRSGYTVCPLCALALQIAQHLTDEQVDDAIREVENEMLRKRYSA